MLTMLGNMLKCDKHATMLGNMLRCYEHVHNDVPVLEGHCF